MNTNPKRRRNSYEHTRRPASLYRFWQDMHAAVWKLQDAAIEWFPVVPFVIFCAVLAGLLLLWIYVFRYLFAG